jgi:hypothetical protein
MLNVAYAECEVYYIYAECRYAEYRCSPLEGRQLFANKLERF